ncbi:hypothetical protein TNCV_5104481 [Trichonephila clavipes]|nr:hypothetical protein TNCV_5104481 [Trichonephila clavipes]
MSDGMVRKWVQQFNDRCTSINGDARSGQLIVVYDGLVEKVNGKIRVNKWIAIKALSHTHVSNNSSLFRTTVSRNFSSRCEGEGLPYTKRHALTSATHYLHIEKLLTDFSATNMQHYFFYTAHAFVDGRKQK